MISRWGSALAAACAGLFALIQAPALAQVEWVTSLSTTTRQSVIDQQYATGTPDGSTVYIAGLVDDGEAQRVRTARISASGLVQWVRWSDGYALAAATPVLAHSDGSVSVAFTGSLGTCVERTSASGVRLMQLCETANISYPTITVAPDDDLLFATGYPNFQRKVRKISPTGVVAWEQTAGIASCCEIYSHGIDSNGNYFELLSNRIRTWRTTDGAIVSDVLLSFTPGTRTSAIMRAGGDLAIHESYMSTSNAVATTVSRYAAAGTRKWSRDIVFPTTTPTQSVTVQLGDADCIYVVLKPYGEGDSQVAKLSPVGVVLWQRHYSRARSVIPAAGGLAALRTDINLGNNTNDSFIFPIAPSDGSLGSPTIYSRSDVFAPNQWFATNNGFVATFQGSNPFAPYTAYPSLLRASSIFIGSAAANRWAVVADVRPAVSASQSDCLMPRLGKSSPASWWARTQPAPQNTNADWSTVNSASGAAEARTTLSAPGCGAPLTSDGGQVVIASSTVDRIKKVSAAGTPVWQTNSANTANYFGSQPLELVAANGEITYTTGSLLGRATAGGSIVFETETNRPIARYLAVDSANSAWVVSSNGSADGYVTRVSPTGVLQWSIAVDSPSCNDSVMAALLTPTDEMLVSTQSCGEGRLFKINGAGQIAWQRIFSGTTLRPYVQLGALSIDSSGNIYAGGCASSGNPASAGTNAISVVASWSGGGSERWTAQGDLIGGASECVTSITTDSSNNVYAASSSSVTTRAPVLWSFTSAGVERWRHSGVLSAPFASITELTTDSADKIVALGEAPPSPAGAREATLRRINVTSLGSSLRLKFLEVPGALVGYREQFPVRIGLRTAADVASNATLDTVVSLGLQNGTGMLDGALTCTIVTGASECTIVDSRYDTVETGVTVTAGADGFATVISSPIGFRKADTATLISALSIGPYNAFSSVRVRASVQGPPPAANQGPGGSLSGPYSPANPGVYSCTYGTGPSGLPLADCDVLVYTAALPLSAQFNSYDNRYNSSTTNGFLLPVTKVMPTLVVSNDPGNSYVEGDRVRFRVALMLPGGFNASQFVAANAVTVTGGTCAGWVLAGSVSDQFAGSYRICEIAAAPLGSLNVSIGFAGSDDLLAAATVAHSVTINSGAIIRGYANVVTSVTVCSPTPGVTCSIESNNSGNWQCVGPVGMSGQVFFVPTSPGGSYNYPGSPVNFSNVTGLVTSPTNVTWAHQVYACKPDVDGDGAVLAMTDGMLVLRRMLGLSGAALIEDVNHTCAPLSAAGVASAITLSNYDIDGDGQVRAETDGLLLLRAMLGFRGTALVNGVTGVGATRQTESQVLNYLRNTCAFQLDP